MLFLNNVYRNKVACLGLRVMCMQFQPSGGPQKGLFDIHENFLKQKLY